MNDYKIFIGVVLALAVFVTGAVFVQNKTRHMPKNMDTSMNMTADKHAAHPEPAFTLEGLPHKTPADRTPLVPIVKEGVKEFHLTADPIAWEYAKGKFVEAWGYNGQIPGPEIRVNEGDKVRVIIQNNLPVGTSLHWHGIHVENSADGTPGLTQYPIKPGETYTYEFTAKNAGTHFYHTHGSSHMDVAMQMDMGLSGAFIIEPKNPKKYDKEYVYMLDEWNINKNGSNNALSMLDEHGEHIHKHEYNIFTINGRIFPDTDPLMVDKGDHILVRLINAGTQEMHPMHLHGHSFRVVAIDGNPVPIAAQQMRDNLPVLPGERYDIEIVADNPGVWVFHCHHVHHASAGMILPFFYEGSKPCCLE
jgi:FtsP/CotA-like multicopper oxidase with cupredoxin domain